MGFIARLNFVKLVCRDAKEDLKSIWGLGLEQHSGFEELGLVSAQCICRELDT